MSQGGIANFLFEQGIPSAKGKERWTQDENTNRKNGYLVQLAEPTGRPFVCAGTATVTLPGYPSGSFGGVPAGWSMASNFTRTRLLFQKHGSKMLSAENWAWRMGENIE